MSTIQLGPRCCEDWEMMITIACVFVLSCVVLCLMLLYCDYRAWDR